MADGKNLCAGTLADLLNGGKPGKVLAEDIEDKEQAVTGIRDDEIREDSVGMSAAFTEYTENAKFLFGFLSGSEINDRASIVIVDMAVPCASTDGAGFQMGLKMLHIGINKDFDEVFIRFSLHNREFFLIIIEYLKG